MNPNRIIRQLCVEQASPVPSAPPAYLARPTVKRNRSFNPSSSPELSPSRRQLFGRLRLSAARSVSRSPEQIRRKEAVSTIKKWWEDNVSLLNKSKVEDIRYDPSLAEKVEEMGKVKKPSLVAAVPRYEQMLAFVRLHCLENKTIGWNAVNFLMHVQQKRTYSGGGKKAGTPLSFTTMHVYADQLFKFLSCKYGESFEGRTYLRNYVAITEIESMAEETEHAPYVDMSYVVSVCERFKTARKPMELLTTLMISITSGRNEDLAHIVAAQLLLDSEGEPTRIAVDWGLRKNARKKALQSSATYDIPEPLRVFITKELLKKLHEVKSGVAKFNSAVRSLDIELPKSKVKSGQAARVSKEQVSSYSFRRFAIQRFIDEYVDAETEQGWDKVLALSGHVSKQMPANVYNKSACEKAVDLMVIDDGVPELDEEKLVNE